MEEPRSQAKGEPGNEASMEVLGQLSMHSGSSCVNKYMQSEEERSFT